jgi:hypothetical protein
MRKTNVARLAGFLGAVGATTALVAAATGSTGAYFSDSRSGTYSGTLGSIKVSTSGGSGTDGLDFSFANMLPGELQTKTANYQNTGANNEDVWLVFPDVAALHGINQLGTFGEAHVASNGTEIFASNNLNDNTSSCPPGSSNPAAGQGACNALPKQIKLADNVTPGTVGAFSFSFAYASKMSNPAFEGQPFNGVGLPYQIVATQHGNTPGA